MHIHLQTPLTRQAARGLKAGDPVLISGEILTARDAAHKRLFQLIEHGEPLPVELEDSVIYYVGATPAPPGRIIGSAGPTTSSRMDAYAPALLDRGLRGMIGKGVRSQTVIDSMMKNDAVYFAAIGGAGALIARSIVASEVVCYEDLGAEAIHRLRVKDFPAVVVIDCNGNNLYETGRQAWLAQKAR